MKVCLFSCLFLFLTACSSNKAEDSKEPVKEEVNYDIEYSFFAAGHLYGNPMIESSGIYAPFMQTLDKIYDHPKMSFGVFTGDVVRKPTPEYWDAYEKDLETIELPIYLTPGNHDGGIEFQNRGYLYYQQFKKHGDLFILIAPNQWNIKDDRLDFLKKTLEEEAKNVNNIFICMHELIWWDPANIFGGVKINYEPHFPGHTNYWEDVHPLLKTYPNNIYLIAGDLGCTDVVSAYTYHKMDNVHFLGSGVGGGNEDNVLIMDIDTEGNVHPHFKKLGSFQDIINIDDYELPVREK